MKGAKLHGDGKSGRRAEKDDQFRNMKERVKQVMTRSRPTF
jgi:hypothetical protein